jgi:hypothetical protein
MMKRQIKIFLADGSPTGLRIAELGLSTVKAVIAPRTKIAELSSRPEARRTGVYILVGPDPDQAGRDAVYIGEGDNVFKRIACHDKDDSKEFWEEVSLFVSKDDNLTKAHVRYLEAQLVRLANAAKRYRVMNATSPDGGLLPEADQAEMEELLEHIQLLLGTVGVSAFQMVSSSPAISAPNAEPGEVELELSMSGQGYAASAVLRDGVFVVRRGSKARREEAPSLPSWGRSTRATLFAESVLKEADGALVFTQDYEFKSASGSAQVIHGASVNGKLYWRLPDGRTFKEWEESKVDQRAVDAG